VPDRKNFFSTSKKEGYFHKKFAFSPFEQYIYITCIKNFPINEVISKLLVLKLPQTHKYKEKKT
jgi:hypothetical protein